MTKQTTTVASRKRTAVSARTTNKPATFYQLVEGARPTSGARLYAHTHAVLSFLGLLGGKSAVRKAVEVLLGSRALNYHVQGHNLAVTERTVKLTSRGVKNFAARVDTGKVDMDMVDAFLAAISKGKPSVAYSISPDHLIPVKDVPLH